MAQLTLFTPEEYLSMKVPSWLLSAALALGRMRIKQLALEKVVAVVSQLHEMSCINKI